MLEYATLNHAGNSQDNPILQGLRFRVTLEKHDSAETLKKAWVESPLGVVFYDLTSLASTTDTTISFAIESGVQLRHAFPAALNVIHVSTSSGKVKRGAYVVSAYGNAIDVGVRLETTGTPPNRIELDGYNGDDFTKPHIIHFGFE